MPQEWTGDLIGRMHNRGVTSKMLASRLGITKEYVSMVFRGKKNPKNAQERFEEAFKQIVSEMDGK